MNILFEEFVGRSLQKALGADRVRLQHQRRALKNPPRHLLRPDMVVDVDDQPVVVLDTKWKRLDGGPEREDVSQMLLYGQAYGAERVILIYPWHEGVGEEGTHRRWTVTGPGYDFETANRERRTPHPGAAESARVVRVGNPRPSVARAGPKRPDEFWSTDTSRL